MILKILSRIPIAGVMLAIVNSYVWSGNFRSDERFAPISAWVRVLGPAILLALFLTSWMLWPMFPSLVRGDALKTIGVTEFTLKPGQLAITVLPTILGFGIGVYALIFTLSANLLNDFHKASAKDGGSALAINADMAYPLLIMVAAIFCSVIQQKFPESGRWLTLNWFLLWYALILTVCLITSLFRLGEVAIVEKIDSP